MAIKIALAGNPNCGKTTMFNALTGANQYVGNWPGVTVEKKEGKLKSAKSGEEIIITDLPGVYSLSPYTLEEVVSRDYLVHEKPQAIINLVDATNIERNLYLTTQILEIGIPVVIALNMADLLAKSGDKIDVKKLSEIFGCEVVETSALKGTGLKEVVEKAIEAAKKNEWKNPAGIFSGSVENAIAKVEELKKESGQSTENKDTPSTSIGMIAQNPNADNGTTKEQTNQSSQGSTSQNTGNTAGPGGDGSNTSTGSSTGTSGSYQDTQNGPGSAVYDSAVRTAIVAYAKQFLGNPYVYGGTSLTNGADCSGFTMRIFEHFGVSTGRTSRDQASNGKQISLSEIQPGDLLFYASGKTINHVALYIGDGKIIHASTSKTGIIISNAYYRTPAKAVTFLN